MTTSNSEKQEQHAILDLGVNDSLIFRCIMLILEIKTYIIIRMKLLTLFVRIEKKEFVDHLG